MEDQDHPLRSGGRRPLTPGTSREAVPNSNQRTDRDGAVSCGSKALPWMAGLRKYRAFPDAGAKGSYRPVAAFPYRHYERAGSARKRSSAQGVGLEQARCAEQTSVVRLTMPLIARLYNDFTTMRPIFITIYNKLS